MDTKQFDAYANRLAVLLPDARRAYGSRMTQSPQHDASREYTQLLVEFWEQDGSLLEMAKRLGVTYAGLRRRVMTAPVPPSGRRSRSKFSDEEYAKAVKDIERAKMIHSTEIYHKTVTKYYDQGYSLARIAQHMGLSSANPLYYAVSRIRLSEQK